MTQWLTERAWKLDEPAESELAQYGSWGLPADQPVDLWILRPAGGFMDPPERLPTPPHTPGYDPPQPVWKHVENGDVDDDVAENYEYGDEEPLKHRNSKLYPKSQSKIQHWKNQKVWRNQDSFHLLISDHEEPVYWYGFWRHGQTLYGSSSSDRHKIQCCLVLVAQPGDFCIVIWIYVMIIYHTI